jgi:hypothetical protein
MFRRILAARNESVLGIVGFCNPEGKSEAVLKRNKICAVG